MRQTISRAASLALAGVFALALGTTLADAQPYGYRHFHGGYGAHGPSFSYSGSNRAHMEQTPGN